MLAAPRSSTISTTTDSQLTLVGWREWVALPGLGIARIKAKIDTGARTSAIHAYFVEPYAEKGAPWVRFGVHPVQGEESPAIICAAPVTEKRLVRDSGGHEEVRAVILTDVCLGADTWPIEATLTNRDSMKFRMLLGRTALRRRHLVDPARSFLGGEPRITPVAESSPGS